MILTLENNENALQSATETLQSGGVCVLPTDTVYGIAASFDDADAIQKLFKLKKRDSHKSIAVLLADASQATLVAERISPAAERLMARFWPGGLTVLVQKRSDLPARLSANEKIGLRIPDHTFTRALIRRTGPLATTSANFSGMPPALEISDLPVELLSRIPLIIDGGRVKQGVSSTVVDCTVEPVLILREGGLKTADILSALAGE